MSFPTVSARPPCGSTARYAYLYVPSGHASASFYLPDVPAPTPVSARPPRSAFVAGRALPLAEVGAEQEEEEEEEEEEIMLPAEEDEQHDDKLKYTTVPDVLSALREVSALSDADVAAHFHAHANDPSAPASAFDADGANADAPRWAPALLSSLARAGQLSALRGALRAAERAAGLDCIRLAWGARLPADAQGCNGEEGAERMMHAVREEVERTEGVLTFDSLHECGLAYSFSVAVDVGALRAAPAGTVATSGSATVASPAATNNDAGHLGAALLRAEAALSGAVHGRAAGNHHHHQQGQQQLAALAAALPQVYGSADSAHAPLAAAGLSSSSGAGSSSTATDAPAAYWLLRERRAPFALAEARGGMDKDENEGESEVTISVRRALREKRLGGKDVLRLRTQLRAVQSALSSLPLDLELPQHAALGQAFAQLARALADADERAAAAQSHAQLHAGTGDRRGRSRSPHAAAGGVDAAHGHGGVDVAGRPGKSGEHRNDSAVAGLGFSPQEPRGAGALAAAQAEAEDTGTGTGTGAGTGTSTGASGARAGAGMVTAEGKRLDASALRVEDCGVALEKRALVLPTAALAFVALA